MKGTISAADANREFSTVLRNVRKGRSFVVTSHGRPVARIVPFSTGERVTSAARAALFERLKAPSPLTIARWTRDDLYEDV